MVTIACGLSIEELLIDYVYDEKALREKLANHSPFFTKCSAGLYFHGHEGKIGKVVSPNISQNVKEILSYYQPGEVIKHGVGAKPYVIRYYIAAPDREVLDSVTDRLYAEVSVQDDKGIDLLYRNQMTKY